MVKLTIMTLSIIMLYRMTLSITIKRHSLMPLSINETQHYNISYSVLLCRVTLTYAQCHIIYCYLSVIMMNVIMLSMVNFRVIRVKVVAPEKPFDVNIFPKIP